MIKLEFLSFIFIIAFFHWAHGMYAITFNCTTCIFLQLWTFFRSGVLCWFERCSNCSGSAIPAVHRRAVCGVHLRWIVAKWRRKRWNVCSRDFMLSKILEANQLLFLHVFRCMTTQCAQPRCADYQLVEGKCCDYTCPGDDDVIEDAARRQEGPLDISQGDLPAAQPSVFNGMTRISF